MIARIPRTVMAAVCVVTGVLLVAFWTTWFIDRDLLASEQRSEYFTFENAFPLADGWMAFCCFAAAWCLFKRRPMAFLWLIAAGSASAFLTGMDVLYDLENGIYAAIFESSSTSTTHANAGAAGIELAINVGTLTFAVVSMTWAWQSRSCCLQAPVRAPAWKRTSTRSKTPPDPFRPTAVRRYDMGNDVRAVISGESPEEQSAEERSTTASFAQAQ